ncbi:methylmalonyl-CoA mutase family protein [Streptomyces sp. NPDC048111]|uniref:methylmalonyl-CoA mutase family protein n=1 Tax=Streptomyces sp. NPDC048111 TaxID=3365500 RepID=UPI00371D3A95
MRDAGSPPVEFDWPTRAGYDSDDPLAHGMVGLGGVAVDSIDDMRVLLAGCARGTTVLTLCVDPPAVPLVLLHQVAAEERGASAPRCAVVLRGADATRPYERRLVRAVFSLSRAEGIPLELTPEPAPLPVRLPAPELVARQAERLAKLRAWRCQERVEAALGPLRRTSLTGGDVLPPMKAALAAGATLGEVSAILRAACPG